MGIACRICGGTLQSVYEFGELPVAGYLEKDAEAAFNAPRFKLGLAMCSACGLLQQKYDEANKFLADIVYKNYQVTYSASQRVSAYLADFASKATTRAKTTEGDVIVEIGCNDGMLLKVLQQAGYMTVGYEPSLPFFDDLAANSIHVFSEYFSFETSGHFLDAFPKARLVIARHTLEHAFEPVDFLRGIAAILDKDGLVAIEVPYLASQVANNHYSSMTFQHVMVFSVSSLCRALEAAELKAVHVDFVETDGGSMVVYARHLGRSLDDGDIRHVSLLEEQLQYNMSEGLASFFAAVDRQRRLVGPLLDELQRKGERVAAYGAGGKGQGLINILNCDVEQIPVAVDSTVQERRYIPGTRIPVINRAQPEAEEATLFFVTAPTHSREIVEKERKDPESTKKFLLVTPHLHFQ